MDVGHEQFVGHLNCTRARPAVGDASGRLIQAPLPVSHYGCSDFRAAKLNCLGKLSAVLKEKGSERIN